MCNRFLLEMNIRKIPLLDPSRPFSESRLVGGNPDFTNAPGHGDEDARFYDRQQAYVHARGG
jgi:hypothetical protein